MQLQLFKTMWGFKGDFETACIQAEEAGFTGIEGSAPADAKEREYWKNCLERHGLAYIAEIVTGGGYVPQYMEPQKHLRDFEAALERSAELNPRFATCIGGSDAWNEAESIRFYEKAMQLAQDAGIAVAFETHRGRPLFTPWAARRIVEALPHIQLTADISHWCVVCERQMDTEAESIDAIAPNVRHIHARVGYDQGPQVPHPAAPEYADALQSHQRCWEQFWRAQYAKGAKISTMTPEFGPDGYLHTLPFTNAPVADLWEINRFMAKNEQNHFQIFMQKESL